MLNTIASYEVLIKQYLYSILDMSAIFVHESIYNHTFSVDAVIFTSLKLIVIFIYISFIFLFSTVGVIFTCS